MAQITNVFGYLENGEEVTRVCLYNDHIHLTLMTYGAAIQNLQLSQPNFPLVLGFHNLQDYLQDSQSVGVTVGRFANRIAHSQFSLDGKEFTLEHNFATHHHIHGGSQGYGKRNWTLTASGEDYVVFSLYDPDDFMGYPGNCHVECRYEISSPATVTVTYRAKCDQLSLMNLTQHSYFNLNGGGDIWQHQLQLYADHYLLGDDLSIPTGEIHQVKGTPFDFTQPRFIRTHDIWQNYDHNFCLDFDKSKQLRLACELSSPQSGVSMKLKTTEPGIIFYTGHNFNSKAIGLNGQMNGACSALCLEPQIWPDAPHHPSFPQAWIAPDQPYFHQTQYEFSFLKG